MMEIKNEAMNKIADAKYEEAIDDFTQIIEKLTPKSEEDFSLQILAYSQRSYCKILIHDFESARIDTDKAIEIAESLRNMEQIMKMPQMQRQEDLIIPSYVEAIARRGNLHDISDECVEALRDYKLAHDILPTEEIKSAYEKLIQSCGIPQLNKEDQKFTIFTDVTDNLLNTNALREKLDKLVEFFAKGNKIPRKDIELYEDTKAINVPDGVLTLYIKDKEIVIKCLKAIFEIGERGCLQAYAFFEDIKGCLERYHDDKDVVEVAISILYDTPEEAFNRFATEDAIDIIVDTLTLDLPEEVDEKVFFVLFNIASNDERTLAVLNNPLVLETIDRKRNIGAAMLMSRLEQCRGFAIDAIKKTGISWMTKLLSDKLPKEKAKNLLIAVTRALICLPEIQGIDAKGEADVAIQKITNVISKYLKDDEIASNTFAALTVCCEYSPSHIRSGHVLNLAALALSMYTKKESAAQNIISFLYACVNHGLIRDIQENPSLVPMIIACIQENAANEVLCVRAIAVLYKIGHPARDALVNLGLQQYPNSPILRSLH